MEIRLKASKTVKFSTQEEADHQLQTISDTEEAHSIALLADPLCEKIDLTANLKSEKISHLSCCGDSDDSGSILDFSWIEDLRRQCIALDIPFYFTGTGANFRMRGRDFRIDKKFQESQARKAEMNYFPLSRAMNPPTYDPSSDVSGHKSLSSGNHGSDNRNTACRNHDTGHSSSDDLWKLGFRPAGSDNSFNPFREDDTSENPFEAPTEFPSSQEPDYINPVQETEISIPHINYRIEVEDEPENEFEAKAEREETLTIPGINYEVEIEDVIEETLDSDLKSRNTDELFSHLARSKFRSSFHLHKLERDYFISHGEEVIRKHAADFIAQRLAPAEPANDGKQTPMKGHPVFIAQHATACCCRGCLKKWHHIPEHRALTEDEKNYVVNVLMAWIKRDITAVPDKKDKQSFERSKLN